MIEKFDSYIMMPIIDFFLYLFPDFYKIEKSFKKVLISNICLSSVLQIIILRHYFFFWNKAYSNSLIRIIIIVTQ